MNLSFNNVFCLLLACLDWPTTNLRYVFGTFKALRRQQTISWQTGRLATCLVPRTKLDLRCCLLLFIYRYLLLFCTMCLALICWPSCTLTCNYGKVRRLSLSISLRQCFSPVCVGFALCLYLSLCCCSASVCSLLLLCSVLALLSTDCAVLGMQQSWKFH